MIGTRIDFNQHVLWATIPMKVPSYGDAFNITLYFEGIHRSLLYAYHKITVMLHVAVPLPLVIKFKKTIRFPGHLGLHEAHAKSSY